MSQKNNKSDRSSQYKDVEYMLEQSVKHKAKENQKKIAITFNVFLLHSLLVLNILI